MATLTRFPLDFDDGSLVQSFLDPARGPLLRLSLNAAGWSALRRALMPHAARPARVVSFLGATHSGKSWHARRFLSSYATTQELPQEGDTSRATPTTGDCPWCARPGPAGARSESAVQVPGV